MKLFEISYGDFPAPQTTANIKPKRPYNAAVLNTGGKKLGPVPEKFDYSPAIFSGIPAGYLT